MRSSVSKLPPSTPTPSFEDLAAAGILESSETGSALYVMLDRSDVTAEELGHILSVTSKVAIETVTRLRRAGWLVKNGKRRRTRTGSMAPVYELGEKGAGLRAAATECGANTAAHSLPAQVQVDRDRRHHVEVLLVSQVTDLPDLLAARVVYPDLRPDVPLVVALDGRHRAPCRQEGLH